MMHIPTVRRCATENSARAKDGFTLAEVIVAVCVLGVGVLGVVTVGANVTSQTATARGELQLWGYMQSVADSLQAAGFSGVTEGSRTIDRYNFSWTLDNATAYLDKVTLIGASQIGYSVADTIVIFVGDANAP